MTDEEIGGIDGAKHCFMDDSGPHITCDICHCPDGIETGHYWQTALAFQQNNVARGLLQKIRVANVCLLLYCLLDTRVDVFSTASRYANKKTPDDVQAGMGSRL